MIKPVIFMAAKKVIITTGTFLNGLVHIGASQTPSGRAGELASIGLANNLKGLGFDIGRMKTGTPPRLRASSIDFSRLERQDSDPDPQPFSFTTERTAAGASAFLFYGHIRRNTSRDSRKYSVFASLFRRH